jgi:hypothetical protein
MYINWKRKGKRSGGYNHHMCCSHTVSSLYIGVLSLVAFDEDIGCNPYIWGLRTMRPLQLRVAPLNGYFPITKAGLKRAGGTAPNSV